MDNSKFYTPPIIATLLINELNGSAPDTIIDICCGSCNLLYAAGKRWPNAKLYGVDIVKHDTPSVYFTQMDGREFTVMHSRKYELVLANPPFGFMEKEREFPNLYAGVFSGLQTKRLENEMFLANLHLMQENGMLLIIVPSTFVEGISHKAIRKIIGKNYFVKSIIKLPKDTFGASYIKSYALIIKHRKNKQQVTSLYSIISANHKGYKFTAPKNVSEEKMMDGEWLGREQFFPDVDLRLRRGNISSQSFVSSGIPVLHTAKPEQNWIPSTRYIESTTKSLVYAEYGDIIISRVGKSAGQWCQYKGDRRAISDCLYVLKDTDGSIIKRIRGKKYSLALKGVSTPYITMEDFAFWYCSLADV